MRNYSVMVMNIEEKRRKKNAWNDMRIVGVRNKMLYINPDECVKHDSKDDKPHIVGRVRQTRKTEYSSLISY